MLKETLVCDKCSKETGVEYPRYRHNQRVSLLNGERSQDPGSGRSSDDTVDLDLCATCLGLLCRAIIKQLPEKTQVELLQQLFPRHPPKAA